MRILILSDVAQGTGFGRVARELAIRFLQAGHQTRLLGVNHRGRPGEIAAYSTTASAEAVGQFVAAYDADPINPLIYPAGAGGDLLGHALTPSAIDGGLWQDHWTPDRVLVVADPRAMGERGDRSGDAFRSVPTFNYVPIEGTGLPPCWDTIWANITPVAMSEFGRIQLEGLLGRPVASIPHGISESFYPVTPERPGWQGVRSKAEAKRANNLEGHLVLLRTDRFVPRKNYAGLLRTVMPVLQERPEALLVIHCAPIDEGGSMAELVSRLPGAFCVGTTWRHPQVRFTGSHDTYRGIPDAALNVLMNAADIYVSPTSSEGFGLTLAEAAACGVPVVTTDYAAGPEAVGPGGVLIPIRNLFTNTNAYEWAAPREDLFTEAVRDLANDPAKRVAIGAAGAAWTRRFSWDVAASSFLDLMR